MGLHTPFAGWLVLPVPEDGDFKFLMQPAPRSAMLHGLGIGAVKTLNEASN